MFGEKEKMPEPRRRKGVIFLALMLVMLAQGLQFIPWVTAAQPPVARFTYTPIAPLINQTVTFDASNSTPDGGTIVNYRWDFGDGPGPVNGSVIMTHLYISNGTYYVTLTVTDSEGKWDTTTKSITIYAHPVAIFNYSPGQPAIYETVTLNASESYDLDGTIVNYRWDFGDATNGTGMSITHVYGAEGNYTVTLNVTDNDGLTNSTSKFIIVITNIPTASFTYSPTVPLVDQIVTFNASLSTPNGGTIVSYLWDFGDGTSVVNETDPISTHTYRTTGTYSVTLNVTDSEGLWDIELKIITIKKYPVASFTFSPLAPIVNEIVSFNASSSYDIDGTIVSYNWNFGDGTNGTDVIATHRYSGVGTFMVTLTVTDNDSFVNSTSSTVTVYIHDVAIVSAALSADEVYVGQLVNITVIVRNKGTTTETFNITFYYHEILIGTQTVTDLAPKTQRTITFSWNTTGTISEVGYTIKAETSTIPGETNIDDNSYVVGIVKVKSLIGSQPIDWSLILTYALPISFVFLSFLAAGIVWKKPWVGPRAVGFDFFNEVTGGGIPDAFSVMIVGGPGSGKSVLCQQLAYDHLMKGKACVYVTYDCFPDEVRKHMKNFHWDTSIYEQKEMFKFVDCYSSIAGVAGREKHHAKQPFALLDLGVAMAAATDELKQKSPTVILDSTAPLFTRLNPAEVTKFLQDRSARIKGDNGTFFFTVGKGTVPPDLMHKLGEIVDCILELYVHRAKKETLRRLRIIQLRGRRFSDEWIPLKIDSKRGITFLAPKGWSKKGVKTKS